MKRFTVFYANQLLLEFDDARDFWHWRSSMAVENREIYNGAYYYHKGNDGKGWDGRTHGWYGMDGVPAWENRITPEMKASLLLL